MHEVDGDLLVGGDRLRHVHVELEAEIPQPGSKIGSWPGNCT